MQHLHAPSRMVGIEEWRARIGLYTGGCAMISNLSKKRSCNVNSTKDLSLMTLLCFCTVVPSCTKCMSYSTIAIQLYFVGMTIGILNCILEAHSGNVERSVIALAILLIVAGDVEQNPGPTGTILYL